MAESILAGTFIEQNFIYIIIIMGVIFGAVFLYKKFQPMPREPDYTKIIHGKMVRDQYLNVPSEHYPFYLVRGKKVLGKIIKQSQEVIKYTPTTEEFKAGRGHKFPDTIIETVVFLPKKFLGRFWYGEEQILKFTKGDGEVVGENLVFPSNMVFNSLGDVYFTNTIQKEATSIIEADWSKRLLESNVSVMASKMSHISAETPEMAHDLALKRLDIERIKAEKSAKLGNMI